MNSQKYLITLVNKLRLNRSDISLNQAFLEVRLLVSFVMKISINQLYFQEKLIISSRQKNKINKLIQMRIDHHPIAHLTSCREFYGEKFIVNSNVLDPRADSESLIELVMQNYSDLSVQYNFLELGVGSGCLIISLLKHYQNSIGLGVDISQLALKIAKKNAKKFNLNERIKFKISDLFSKVSPTKKFAIIISNPPYIPSKQIDQLQIEVAKYEPRIALDGGIDGLDFYRKIAMQAKNYLTKNGSIFLEIGFNQEQAVIKIFEQYNFKLIAKKNDLANITRALHFRCC